MTIEAPPLGLVLAGGLARRMGGGDKLLTRIGGTTILSRVLERLKQKTVAPAPAGGVSAESVTVRRRNRPSIPPSHSQPA